MPVRALRSMSMRPSPATQLTVSLSLPAVDGALALLQRGATNRTVAQTEMNKQSSRSHFIFTCMIEGRSVGESGNANVRRSRLHLVDLAGSERFHTDHTHDRVKEMSSINRSLSALGNVIAKLNEEAAHVPYRDSKLTFLLHVRCFR